MNIFAISSLDDGVDNKVIESYAKEVYPDWRFTWIGEDDSGYTFYTRIDEVDKDPDTVDLVLSEYINEYVICDTILFSHSEDFPHSGGWYAVKSSSSSYVFGKMFEPSTMSHRIEVMHISEQ